MRLFASYRNVDINMLNHILSHRSNILPRNFLAYVLRNYKISVTD